MIEKQEAREIYIKTASKILGEKVVDVIFHKEPSHILTEGWIFTLGSKKFKETRNIMHQFMFPPAFVSNAGDLEFIPTRISIEEWIQRKGYSRAF